MSNGLGTCFVPCSIAQLGNFLQFLATRYLVTIFLHGQRRADIARASSLTPVGLRCRENGHQCKGKKKRDVDRYIVQDILFSVDGYGHESWFRGNFHCFSGSWEATRKARETEKEGAESYTDAWLRWCVGGVWKSVFMCSRVEVSLPFILLRHSSNPMELATLARFQT